MTPGTEIPRLTALARMKESKGFIPPLWLETLGGVWLVVDATIVRTS